MAAARLRSASGSKSGRRRARHGGAAVSTAAGDTTAARVQAMVERELDAVERVLAVLSPDDAGDAERSARTLASLARTLRELSAMSGAQPTAETASDDDDAIPRDLDEFRRALARRIEAFVGERPDSGFSDDAGAGLERPARA
ncbi:MAG: hypothetical protein AB7O50_09380 [Pseudolabrys sp.]